MLLQHHPENLQHCREMVGEEQPEDIYIYVSIYLPADLDVY